MKFCLITPYENLEESKEGDMFYALTRELLENKTYYNWFKDIKRKGGDVIIDNNVHEKSEVSFEDHVHLAIDVATIIVVPDVMRDKKKTLEYFHYFMDKFYPLLKLNGIKILAVPQGNTFEEINECFDEFNKDKRVDIIGHSFDLEPYQFVEDKYSNQSMNRITIVSHWLQKTNKDIHLLGSNNLWELYLLGKNKRVVSTDGKLFSRLALSNIEVTKDNWEFISKPDTKMKFSDVLSLEQKRQFIKNIRFFKRMIEDDKHI